MSEIKNKQDWEKYCTSELEVVLPILKNLGFKLEDEQPHLGGERYLMQAVTTTSGKKLILLGCSVSDNKRVVIKATSDHAGTKELEKERSLRMALKKINFAYQTFHSPEELLFVKQADFTISIQAFIEKDKQFIERSTEEQFSLALKAFKAQEGAQATTYKHRRFIKKTFGEKNAEDYLKDFLLFKKIILKTFPEKRAVFGQAEEFLSTHVETIEQYCGFLTHTDFVPHNFRFVNNNIYLLDHSSIRFGNKYDGWARFINFMALYNPELEQTIVEYVRNNRTPEESLSLKLMRIYRLGEIIYYYTNTLQRSSGNLLELNRARIDLWSSLLEAVLENKVLDKNLIEKYKKTRDLLRDKEELERQEGLH